MAASPAAIIGTAQMHALDRTLGARPVSAPGTSAERTQALVAGANRIAYGYYSVRGGRLHAHLWLADTQTEKIVQVADANTPANDALGAATDLARQLAAGQLAARPAAYYTRSEACLRAYAEGLESKGIPQASARMEEAIAADPDFGPAYRSLAELDVQRQDRNGARAILGRGLARGGMAPIERARVQFDAASMDNDPAAKQQALAAIAKLEPGNAGAWQSFADAAMARHDYPAAVDGYHRALAIEPDSAAVLNQLGYAETWAGHFDEGVAALRKYRSLRPKDANGLDSLGDLNLIENRYKEAEDFYRQAYKLDPNFNGNCDLFKAAMARAMTGDVAGAEDFYKQYIAARTLAHDPDAPFEQAEWLWLTGRRKQAADQELGYAETAEAHNDRSGAARAYAQMAVWDLMTNDRAAAQERLKAAAPPDAASSSAVLIARFLAQPSASAAEWQARADRLAPNAAQNAVKLRMLGWALLLDHQFAAAKAALQKIYDTTGVSSNEGITVLLAWCDVETGDYNSAAPLLAQTPVPPASGVSTFMPLWFPRIFELRAAVAEKGGRADEAKQDAGIVPVSCRRNQRPGKLNWSYQFAMAVMTIEFVKSIRKAPTMGTTRKDCGAGASFSTNSSMQATALAVMPSMNPQNPAVVTAAS